MSSPSTCIPLSACAIAHSTGLDLRARFLRLGELSLRIPVVSSRRVDVGCRRTRVVESATRCNQIGFGTEFGPSGREVGILSGVSGRKPLGSDVGVTWLQEAVTT